MPSQKIVVYFTPDIKETGRIFIDDIKFETSDDPKRGRYQISLTHPCLIEAVCSSPKSAITADARITFHNFAFGEQTKYIFRTNDFFQIWDTTDGDEWCYFRGVAKQISTVEDGNNKRTIVICENAAGWALGDNSIYYLRPLLIVKENIPVKIFDPIKTRYGWLKGNKETDEFKNIRIEKIKKPSGLLKTLIDQIGNVRIDVLRKEFYDNSEAVKKIDYSVEGNVEKNNIFIADKLSEMEGSILNILQKFEGRPFSEIFLIETLTSTKVIWRNTRWRDFNQELCMGKFAGEPQNLITLYTDPKESIKSDRQVVNYSGGEGYQLEKFYSGIWSENVNRTNDDVINAVFLYPATMDTKTNVPALVIAQIRYDQDGAKRIFNIDSVVRHGYKPVVIQLPFVPGYMEPKDYNNVAADKRLDTASSYYRSVGEYLSEFTRYAFSMYNNIQNSSNGSDVFQNNLHITHADDFRIVRRNTEDDIFVNVNKITWNFNALNPTTVIEWDRGFERSRYSGYTARDFEYV